MKKWIPDRKIWLALATALATVFGGPELVDAFGLPAETVNTEQIAAVLALLVAYFVPPSKMEIVKRVTKEIVEAHQIAEAGKKGFH